jgi:hypothetical protein
MTSAPGEQQTGIWMRMRRIFGYAALASLIATLIFLWMLLRKPALAFPETSDEAAASFNDKIARLATASDFGVSSELHLTSAELNSQIQQWLKANPQPPGTATMTNGAIHLEGDRMIVILLFDVRGFDVYMTIDGNLLFTNHIVRLVPAEVHIGSTPVPVTLLEGKIDLQMELPDAVTAIRVENGELVIEAQ